MESARLDACGGASGGERDVPVAILRQQRAVDRVHQVLKALSHRDLLVSRLRADDALTQLTEVLTTEGRASEGSGEGEGSGGKGARARQVPGCLGA